MQIDYPSHACEDISNFCCKLNIYRVGGARNNFMPIPRIASGVNNRWYSVPSGLIIMYQPFIETSSENKTIESKYPMDFEHIHFKIINNSF